MFTVSFGIRSEPKPESFQSFAEFYEAFAEFNWRYNPINRKGSKYRFELVSLTDPKKKKYGAEAERIWNAHQDKLNKPAKESKPKAARKPKLTVKLGPVVAKAETPAIAVADTIASYMQQGTQFDAKTFFKIADEAYGGNRAQGTYGPSEAYDALEAGVNKSFAGKTSPTVDAQEALKQADAIAEKVKSLPTQTNRSGNKDAFQQFSTPPHYAYVASWLANLKPDDIVLEPTAGTGCLAVQAANSGAKVYGNEYDPKRAELLRNLLGKDRVFTENAEQISGILASKMPAPTTVVMNPPFSQTAGRLSKKVPMTAAKHIDEALNLLAPGGRLVAIVGRGMSPDAPTFKSWYNALRGKYNLRANVGVSGKEYTKYGTSFDTRILVIDKTGPQQGETVTGDVDKVSDLITKLEGVRNDRPRDQQSSVIPVGPSVSGSTEGRSAVPDAIPGGLPGGPQARQQGQDGRAEADGLQQPEQVRSDVLGGGHGPVGGGGIARKPRSPRGVVKGKDTKGNGGASPGELQQQPNAGWAPPEPIKLVNVSANPENEPGFTGYDRLGRKWVNGELVAKDEIQKPDQPESQLSLYEQYKPALLHVEGAQQHNTPLVESAAMASVLPPVPTYQPVLSPDIVNKGVLSEAQLEAVVYAGQSHEQILPDGQRRGYFIGDGTGVGKGREISGVLLDNWNQGRKRHVWVSQKQTLFEDAKRDWSALGGDPDKLIHFDKFKKMKDVPEDAIIFVTYDTLKGGPKAKEQPRNYQVLAKWLGTSGGVIAFDEAHGMANAIDVEGERGTKKASSRAIAGTEFQKLVPESRVLYVSATGATEVSNLAYADRLGLWGRGTEFADKADFIAEMQNGGVAAMEAVAQSMKAMGRYGARSLSFDGVSYNKLEHQLSDEQRFIYNAASDAWQKIMADIPKAIGMTGGTGKERAAAMSQFWGSQQRFFNQVMTSMQTESVINAMEDDLQQGKSPVIQLTNTMEAALKKAIEEKRAKGADIDEDEEAMLADDLDVSPRQILVQFLENSFPVNRVEEYEDEEGRVRTRPVLDSSGNVVKDPRAVAMRDEYISLVKDSLRIPESPIDQIINHFGADNVAEATGRTIRRVLRPNDKGEMAYIVEDRNAKAANSAEAAAFQDGRKKILIFSDAGGTGRSYHADKKANNQAQRVHYLLQPGWRADNAVQGFGRTHRTNQSSAPEYRLVQIAELPAQKRFISTIARRLDQLGALTKGQASTGGGGMFEASDNLESPEAKAALRQLIDDLQRRQNVTDLGSDILDKMGYRVPEEGDLETNMNQFLNRMLVLNVEDQSKVFAAFDNRLKKQIEFAEKEGTLNRGVSDYEGTNIRKVKDTPIYRDASGAEARVVVAKVTNKLEKRAWQSNFEGEKPVGFLKRKDDGTVFSVYNGPDETVLVPGKRGKKEQRIVQQYVLRDVKGKRDYKPRSDAYGWHQNVEKINEEQAKELWEKQYADAPSTEETEEHFVTGAMLPVWKKIPGKPKIFRVKAADGTKFVGRHVFSRDVAELMQNLGIHQEIDRPKPTSANVHAGLESGKTKSVKLSNKWTLKPVLVGGERRIELVGPSAYHWSNLEQDGVIRERIAYDSRLFIPTGRRGRDVLDKILKNTNSNIADYEGDLAKPPGSDVPTGSENLVQVQDAVSQLQTPTAVQQPAPTPQVVTSLPVQKPSGTVKISGLKFETFAEQTTPRTVIKFNDLVGGRRGIVLKDRRGRRYMLDRVTGRRVKIPKDVPVAQPVQQTRGEKVREKIAKAKKLTVNLGKKAFAKGKDLANKAQAKYEQAQSVYQRLVPKPIQKALKVVSKLMSAPKRVTQNAAVAIVKEWDAKPEVKAKVIDAIQWVDFGATSAKTLGIPGLDGLVPAPASCAFLLSSAVHSPIAIMKATAKGAIRLVKRSHAKARKLLLEDGSSVAQHRTFSEQTDLAKALVERAEKLGDRLDSWLASYAAALDHDVGVERAIELADRSEQQ